MGLDLPVVTLVSMVSYVCASASTPLGAVLLAKGVSPGAVFAGLVVGPVTNVATLYFVKRTFGTRAAVFGFLSLLGMATVFALAINTWVVVVPNLPSPDAEHTHGMIATAATVLLVTFALRNLWLEGLRAWIASIVSTGGPGDGHHRDCSSHRHDALATSEAW